MPDALGISGVPAISPAEVPADAMHRPEDPDIRFEGFGMEAFDVLERLRCHPHIGEYRKQKETIRSYIQEPFKRYRDDLVVNWVLPNRIDLETEKNVFSRFLKNDFGAGGCHHHFWMSFYRPGRRRLKDVQLAHSLWPEALYIVAYVGNPVPNLFKKVRRSILRNREDFLGSVNPLLQTAHATFSVSFGSTREGAIITEPLEELPEGFEKSKEVAVSLAVPRDEVIELGPRIIDAAMASIEKLWPVYRFFLQATTSDA